MGITQSAAGRIVAGAAGTSILDGYVKGIVTEVSGTSVGVKVLQHVSTAGTVTNVNYQNGGIYNFTTGIISVSGVGTVGAGFPVGAVGSGGTAAVSSVTDLSLIHI